MIMFAWAAGLLQDFVHPMGYWDNVINPRVIHKDIPTESCRSTYNAVNQRVPYPGIVKDLMSKSLQMVDG